jgi:spore cortex formation protein SpoVR/YcgB (stage V sporulation)
LGLVLVGNGQYSLQCILIFLHFVGHASFYGNNFTMGVFDTDMEFICSALSIVHPTTNSSGADMSLELIVDCPLQNDSAVDYSCGTCCNNF